MNKFLNSSIITHLEKKDKYNYIFQVLISLLADIEDPDKVIIASSSDDKRLNGPEPASPKSYNLICWVKLLGGKLFPKNIEINFSKIAVISESVIKVYPGFEKFVTCSFLPEKISTEDSLLHYIRTLIDEPFLEIKPFVLRLS